MPCTTVESSNTVNPTYRAILSCDKPNHVHIWPTTGELEIERCEHYCLYCRGPKATKKWSSAWFLRRHVRETHAKFEFPGLTVSEGWARRPTGNTRPATKKQRAPGSNKKRAGTKKDRLKVIEQARGSTHPTAYEQAMVSTHHQKSLMPSSTAGIANVVYAPLSVQSFGSTPEMTATAFAEPLDFTLGSWHSGSPQQSIDPKSLERLPASNIVPPNLGNDLFDFDSYDNITSSPFADSAVGSFVEATAVSTIDDSIQEPGTTTLTPPLPSDEAELAKQLLANIQQHAQPHAANFEEAHNGAQFAEYNFDQELFSFGHFATDPIFGEMLSMEI